MRVLVIGAGGVGSAVASVAQRRGFFERIVLADVDEDRARRAVERTGDSASAAAAVDASDAAAIAELARAERADAILNAVDPALQPADLPGGVRRGLHLPRHGDDPLGRRDRA